MDDFLSSNIGQKIRENYDKKKDFTPEERDFLAASIVKEHLEHNVSMTISILENIATQISQIFKGESKVICVKK